MKSPLSGFWVSVIQLLPEPKSQAGAQEGHRPLTITPEPDG